MNGKQVTLYEGTLPQSGKQVFYFNGIKLVHRSLKKDKSDLLVHFDSRAIIMAYPLATERSVILNHIASKVDVLMHFIENQDMYEVKPKEIVKKEKPKEKVYTITKEPSYSSSGKFGSKKYDIRNVIW